MIVFYNVCDHCGTQKEISSGSLGNGFSVKFSIEEAYEQASNPHKYGIKSYQGTFCDRECFLEWMKENMNSHGMIKIKAEE